MQVKRTNALFFCCSSSENINCHSIQAARKKYANNIKHALDFCYSQFYMATFQTATHGEHVTLNAYLSFWVSINRMLILQLKYFYL